MAGKNTKPEESKNPITNSDWVSYLMSLSSSHDNYLIALAAIVIAGVFGGVEVLQWFGRPKYEALIPTIFFLGLYIVGFIIIKNQKKQFDDLAEEIILGDLTDQEEIKKRYKKIKGINVND